MINLCLNKMFFFFVSTGKASRSVLFIKMANEIMRNRKKDIHKARVRKKEKHWKQQRKTRAFASTKLLIYAFKLSDNNSRAKMFCFVELEHLFWNAKRHALFIIMFHSHCNLLNIWINVFSVSTNTQLWCYCWFKWLVIDW